MDADGPIGVTEVAERRPCQSRQGARRQHPRGEGRQPATQAVPRISVDLAFDVGEAAGLSVPDGDLVHYVEQVDTPNPVAVRDWTGSRLPMHAVSSGQVLLAFRPAAALERCLERPLERFTELTLVDPDDLRERLREVRRDGFAWAREEFDRGISSVAAPIADASGEVVAAVHVHGPSYRFPAPGTAATTAGRVLTTAARIAGSIRQVI